MKAQPNPKVSCLFAIAAGILAASPTLFAADPLPPTGQLLASQCFQCHTDTGGQTGGFDSITGKNASEIVKEMKEMKNKNIPEDIMERHSKGYTDAQILQIATYLATLPPTEDDGDDD